MPAASKKSKTAVRSGREPACLAVYLVTAYADDWPDLERCRDPAEALDRARRAAAQDWFVYGDTHLAVLEVLPDGGVIQIDLTAAELGLTESQERKGCS